MNLKPWAWAATGAMLIASGARGSDLQFSFPQSMHLQVLDPSVTNAIVSPDYGAIWDDTGTLATAEIDTYSVRHVSTGALAEGIDIRIKVTNAQLSPQPIAFRIPGIRFARTDDSSDSWALNTVRVRDFERDGKVLERVAQDEGICCGETAPNYPKSLFSPLAYLHNGDGSSGYDVGVSIQYPMVDPGNSIQFGCGDHDEYGHGFDVSTRLGNTGGPQSAPRAWFVRYDNATIPGLMDGEPTVRYYTLSLSIRPNQLMHAHIMDNPREFHADDPSLIWENAPYPDGNGDGQQDWMKLFQPYTEYFRCRYGNRAYGAVDYGADYQVVLASQVAWTVDAQNPWGYLTPPGSSQGRPDTDGWGDWAAWFGDQQDYFHRIMVWAASGIFPANRLNYPFPVVTHWYQIAPATGSPIEDLHYLSGDQDARVWMYGTTARNALGLWWGRSTQVMTTWDPNPSSACAVHPLTRWDTTTKRGCAGSTNPPWGDREWAFAEMDAAMHGVDDSGGPRPAMIGLDAFGQFLEIADTYHWLEDLRSHCPQTRFIVENPCDVVASLSPGWVAGTRPRWFVNENSEVVENGSFGLRVLTPHYLRDLLVPGHETWVQVLDADLATEYWWGGMTWPPAALTDAELTTQIERFANLGLVPAVYRPFAYSGTPGAVHSVTVPCDLLNPELRLRGGQVHQGGIILAQTGASVTMKMDVYPHSFGAGGATGRWHFVPSNPGSCSAWYLSGPPTYTIASVQSCDVGTYTYLVQYPECGSQEFESPEISLQTELPCDPTDNRHCDADFNGDGDIGTDLDIELFFSTLSGNRCCTCESADFNGDGDIGTDADIESFFSVLGAGPC